MNFTENNEGNEGLGLQLDHPLAGTAEKLSGVVISAAIEVHRIMGAGLVESIYERCLGRELELRGHRITAQRIVSVEYKGLRFEEPLRCDLIVDDCLLIELKAVEAVLPIHKAQVLSYLKLLNIPLALLINFHVPLLKNGISRLIHPGLHKK